MENAKVNEPLSVEEIEAANWPVDDGRVPCVPFGFLHGQWLAFKGKKQPGDQIVAFRSSDDSWRHLAGSQGYFLVREGKMISVIVTERN